MTATIPVVEKVIDFHGGSAVLRDASGRLFVGRSDQQGEPREVDPADPIGLLPLLELGPDIVPTEVVEAMPMHELLVLALATADYWPRLAVDWLDRTHVPGEVRSALADFAHGNRGSQQTRHAARRLLEASA